MVPFQIRAGISLSPPRARMMGNSCTSARSAKAPPQDTMETPPSRCETKEEPTAWCPSSNRLNKEGNYAVPETDAESHAMMPSTTTITLMDSWTMAHTQKLRVAVKDVVAANPILSGKIVAGEDGKGLAIAPSMHDILDPATLNVVAGPSDFEPPADIVARCSYCQDVLGPLVPDLGTTIQQKASGGPLFNVSIIKLPDHRAAYVVSLSHIIGDGWTYYALIDQLDCLVNEKTFEPLVWDDPGVSREIDHLSERDKFRSFKLMIPAFICRMLYNFFTGGRSSHILEVIDSDAMAELKKASRGTAAFVSTNDVVTAAVYEIFDSKLAMMATNLRGANRLAGLPPHSAGNFERLLLHPRAPAAESPAFIREKLLSSPSGFFGKNEVPFWPMATSDVGFITNWTSLTKFIVTPGATVSCHVPECSGNEGLFQWPLNAAIIFQADPTTIVCAHNLKASKVKNRAQSAKLFPKVFKLPAE